MKDFPTNEREAYQTLGGFILTRFGRLPAIGDKFNWENHIFEVVDKDVKRVNQVLFKPIKSNEN